ncbi:hypothetical protein KQX54_020128 [Cotesia glomerata]|uniref:Uncharacterized protein n=1 Tax=Cotesia glomerata TaxID=32391 RepID=A0AAV7J665_COTGL|nr:hypothetical protein KQX54_020128 [Cotesia glomerata]
MSMRVFFEVCKYASKDEYSKLGVNSVPLVNVSAVEGGAVELPCDITPIGYDALHMVMWFKGHAGGTPLYT